jgi:hypothetical protein
VCDRKDFFIKKEKRKENRRLQISDCFIYEGMTEMRLSFFSKLIKKSA